MNGQAALSLGSIVNRLLYVFPCSAFKAIHIDTLRLFTNAMTDMTCLFLQAVAKEEEVTDENSSKNFVSLVFVLFFSIFKYIYDISMYKTRKPNKASKPYMKDCLYP